MGIALSYFGSFLGIKRIWLERIGGVLIILFGLDIIGILKLRFLSQGKGISLKRNNFGYIGSLLVGMAFAFGWTPCVGPILSSILIYASTLESLPKATTLLLAYSMGLGLPFFIAGLAVNKFLFLFAKFRNFMRFAPIISGVFLILMGALLFSGQFSRIAGIFTKG